MMTKKPKYTNLLINETSPYLLQHAQNPVNWLPWNRETLQKAKTEGKLMLISIGYSACHWCHVMEHESFEDEYVAKIMNEHFVCIKVDREERPDVDQVYMEAVQMLTGQGGWPLNCFALPDGSPVWGGTYFPKESWISILQQLVNLYLNDNEKTAKQAKMLKKGMSQSDLVKAKDSVSLSKESIQESYSEWSKIFDIQFGGNQGAPKFPMPAGLEFLLQYNHLSGSSTALEHVNNTLEKMAMGGIYDQLEGGFARYSVDDKWFAPHFEKMLYDNGQLISLYSKAFQVTGKNLFKDVVFQTIDFVKKKLTDSNGAFYSALDADSEGIEGKSYTWTRLEIEQILKSDADWFCKLYGVEQQGNWENGTNILYLNDLPEEFIKNSTNGELEALKTAKTKLLAERNKRIQPGLDNKVLSSWNALMLGALCDAYIVFSQDEHYTMALRNAEFIASNMVQNNDKIYRSYSNGKVKIEGFLDDYAITAWAFTKFYQISFNEKWLFLAKRLIDYAIDHFYDEKDNMFFYTSDQDDPLVIRKKEIHDNVIPSSNSYMAIVLKNLSEYFSDVQYAQMYKSMIRSISSNLLGNLPYYAQWGQLVLYELYGSYELAVAGKNSASLNSDLKQKYLPNILRAAGLAGSKLPILKEKFQKNQTLYYLCTNGTCRLPVNSVEDALKQIPN